MPTIDIENTQSSSDSDSDISNNEIYMELNEEVINLAASLSDSDSDDDMIKIPRKKLKVDLSDTLTESQKPEESCVICYEAFTVSGLHKLVSIKCGHFFGRGCIERWLQQPNGGECPICKHPFRKLDIRPHFLDLQGIKMEDNTELIEAQCKLTLQLGRIRNLEEENSVLKLNTTLLNSELAKATTELKLYQNRCQLMSKNISMFKEQSSGDLSFSLAYKICVSKAGECRVMANCNVSNYLLISSPFKNNFFPGFGVRVFDAHTMRSLKLVRLHDNVIRDLAFSKTSFSNFLLSCSMDKTVKLSSMQSESIIFTAKCRQPVWSVCWSSNNNNIFYAGLSNGDIDIIDSRRPDMLYDTIYSKAGGPVSYLQHISGSQFFSSKSGIIVSNPKGTIFLASETSPSVNDNLELPKFKNSLSTLLLPNKYGGALMHSTYNDKTGHLVSTVRTPGIQKIVFSAIEVSDCPGRVPDAEHPLTPNDSSSSTNIYAMEVKVIPAGRKTTFMKRSCFLNSDVNDSVYVVIPNEEMSSVSVYSSEQTKPHFSVFPSDVSPAKPVIDTCQIRNTGDELTFAALNCDNVHIFRQSTAENS